MALEHRAGGAGEQQPCDRLLSPGHLTGPTEPARPDGLYGVSKVVVEALGQLYADKCGQSVMVRARGSASPAFPTPCSALLTCIASPSLDRSAGPTALSRTGAVRGSFTGQPF